MFRNRQSSPEEWERVLDLCRSTRTMMTCLVIGLLGGAGFVAFLMRLPQPPAPLTADDVIPLVGGGILFSAFFPLSMALGIGRALLERDRTG